MRRQMCFRVPFSTPRQQVNAAPPPLPVSQQPACSQPDIPARPHELLLAPTDPTVHGAVATSSSAAVSYHDHDHLCWFGLQPLHLSRPPRDSYWERDSLQETSPHWPSAISFSSTINTQSSPDNKIRAHTFGGQRKGSPTAWALSRPGSDSHSRSSVPQHGCLEERFQLDRQLTQPLWSIIEAGNSIDRELTAPLYTRGPGSSAKELPADAAAATVKELYLRGPGSSAKELPADASSESAPLNVHAFCRLGTFRSEA